MSARVKTTGNKVLHRIDLANTVTFIEPKTAADFKCGICLYTIKNTVQVCDNHHFCEDCIDQLIRRVRRQNSNVIECPSCRTQCAILLIRRNKFIDRLIGSLLTRCPNHQITQQKALYLQQSANLRVDIDPHLDIAQLPHTNNANHNHNHNKKRENSASRSRSRSRSRERNENNIENKNSETDTSNITDNARQVTLCEWIGPFSELQEHTDICAEHTIQCGDCFQLMIRNESAMHIYFCPNAMINCSECGLRIRREQYIQHLDECLETMIVCTYHIYGCPGTFRRKDEKEHMESLMVLHLDMVNFSNRDLSDKVNNMGLKLKRMQKKHSTDCRALLERIEELELEFDSSDDEEEDESDESDEEPEDTDEEM